MIGLLMLLLLVPVYGAISAIFLTTMIGLCFYRSRDARKLIKEAVNSLISDENIEESLRGTVGNDSFEQEVEDTIDEKLDDLVIVFKKQIPMASTFLVGPLAEKLKGSAKVEIMKIVPDLKDKVMKRVNLSQDSDLISDKILESISWNTCKPIVLRVWGWAALMGIFLGFLQLAWMFILGYI